MDFLLFQNTIYFVIIALIAGGILFFTSRREGSGNGALSAKEAVHMSNTQHAQFIDVRSLEEFKKSSIPQSKHFPAETIEEKIKALPKKPLILVCHKGRSAQKVAQLLKKNQVENVYWIRGGLTEWLAEGFPVKTGAKA